MGMPDGPVRVVGECVYGLHRHHRSFKGRHTVEGDSDHEELKDDVCAQLVPSPAKREQPVDHPTPRGRDEHNREHHTEGLRPIRQRGV